MPSGTTFCTNPQFRISVEDPDSGDEDETGTVIVGLMQANRRTLKREGRRNLAIGYYIYSVRPHHLNCSVWSV